MGWRTWPALTVGMALEQALTTPSCYHFRCQKAFKGIVIANKGYSRDIGEGVLRSGSADLVGFSRMFMANPDLVERFKHGWPLTPLMDYESFWDPAKGEEGYTTLSSYKP
ncbi:unnamed protein product [Phytophthora lilii]|uniref:Unnamed protein product n=1 Tax=Phytophthora lilii TaxID=2077276 RepID=A0A9W6YI98_9STRA|nr:unnamed protein product [Phytophthora lilii]